MITSNTNTTTLLLGSEGMDNKNIAKEIVAQSAIPLDIRKSLSNEVSKPRTREQLKSSLFLQR